MSFSFLVIIWDKIILASGYFLLAQLINLGYVFRDLSKTFGFIPLVIESPMMRVSKVSACS